MTWEEFKQKLIALPKSDVAIKIERMGTIVDEELFVSSHIRTIDSYPKKENLSQREKDARIRIAKPHYDRLMVYYLLKTQL